MASYESPDTTASASVVLAENDRLVSEVLGELLRSKGYDVHVARDGLEALHLIRTIRPALVILDVVMPKLDGSHVCWLVRQDPALRDTPIVVFSSLSARDLRHFPDLSADAYVAKGPATDAFENILKAIEHVRAKDRTDMASGIFGYDEVKPREVVGELVEELRHVASVLQSLGPGTMEVDREGRIVRLSMGACEILGKNESQLIGESLPSLCPASDRETVRNLIEELGKADRPERCRTVLRLGDLEIPVQLCPIVERMRCTGVFLVMESRGVRADTANR